MIQSFAAPGTELIWSGRRTREPPPEIQAVTLRKLRLLNQARVLADLRRAARQSPRGARRRPRRPAFGQDQRSMAHLLCLDRRRTVACRSSSTTTTDLLPNPTPGEILAEKFLKPMGLNVRLRSRAPSACRRAASTKLFSASARSRPTPICASRAISACPRGSFSACRRTTICMERRRQIGRTSRRSNRAPHEQARRSKATALGG